MLIAAESVSLLADCVPHQVMPIADRSSFKGRQATMSSPRAR